MGDCMNCKRNAGTEAMESSSTNLPLKKMKIGNSNNLDFEELKKLPALNYEHHPRRFFAISLDNTVSPATSSNAGRALAAGDSSPASFSSSSSSSSRCFPNESSEVVQESSRLVDLEAKSFETESSTCVNNKNKFRETTPSSSSEFYGDTDMDSPAAADKNNSRTESQATSEEEKMPSQTEIDEFFAVAEKNEQKRFAEKYNYDIVKDAPLEGRYQWIRLKP